MKLLNKILIYCTRDLKKAYWASRIAKDLKMNQKTVSNILHRLEDDGFMVSETQGRNRVFRIRCDNINILIHAELWKNQYFLDMHKKIREIIKDIDILSPHLIFGSYAKGIEKKKSDIDILVIGDYDKKKKKEAEIFHDIKIQVFSFTEESLLKNNLILNEIIKDYIIISGFEYFLRIFLSYQSIPV